MVLEVYKQRKEKMSKDTNRRIRRYPKEFEVTTRSFDLKLSKVISDEEFMSRVLKTEPVLSFLRDRFLVGNEVMFHKVLIASDYQTDFLERVILTVKVESAQRVDDEES